VYDESRARSGGGGQQTKARTAAQQLVIDNYRIVFAAESFMRAYMADSQLLPILLELHQRIIEGPLRAQNEFFIPWSLPLLKRHFDPRAPHIFDPVRAMRYSQSLVLQNMAQMNEHIFEPDPANPAHQAVNAKAVAGLNAFIEKNIKLVATLRKMQTENDENASTAMFALVSTIKRIGGLQGVDEEILRNPQMAAGTMVAAGSAIRTATNTNGQPSMYQMSGF
jgi:hypothetical protein